MIQVDRLSKTFGTAKAVDSISFQVARGEILGFLGPNGAGKSTTMKMLTGFLTPTAGTATIGGFDILSQSLQARKIIGYLPESAASYKNMTVLEFLSFIADIRGFSGVDKQMRLDSVLDTTSLESVQYQTIDTLSKGFRQRVGFAQALIHDPPVLILDEPTDGLDPNQKFEARGLIKRMSAEKSIILSTHILEEMEAVCDRAVIIDKGKVVADSSPAELIRQSDHYNGVLLSFESHPGEQWLESLHSLEEVDRIEILSSGFENQLLKVRIYPSNKKNILTPLHQFFEAKQNSPLEIQLETGQMEDVFRNLTSRPE